MLLHWMILLTMLVNGTRGNRYNFMHKPIGYQDNKIMDVLNRKDFEEKALELGVADADKSQSLDQVTICLEMALSYGLPACLFDVGGIQFFYSSPASDLGYGHIRFKNESDRTVNFFPKTRFEAKKYCLPFGGDK